MIIFLPPVLYRWLQERGYDMRGFQQIEPLPKSQ